MGSKNNKSPVKDKVEKKKVKLKKKEVDKSTPGKKKKLSARLKRANILLIIALFILICVLVIVLIKMMTQHDDFYTIESREEKIQKSKKLDSSDYETIGWIRVQGTNIDYPLYGIIRDSYEYPVTKSYLWSLNHDRDFHNVMIAYGHNIMNLGPQPRKHDENFTRMEELMSYVYYDFAQENKYIQLTINGKDYLYKIFAVNFMPVTDLNEYPEGEFVQQDRNNYVNRLLKESIYDYQVDLQDDDKVLSVVTCSRFFGDGQNYDFIVTGRLVREGEDITNYKVFRNKNYEKVDDKLKGDEKNDKSIENA